MVHITDKPPSYYQQNRERIIRNTVERRRLVMNSDKYINANRQKLTNKINEDRKKKVCVCVFVCEREREREKDS